ncbi:MAG: MFS transporter [Phycisphaerae bacterium]|jgi:putative MFS transporter|nr:MFS transporter [Phycisphaerae bacterium]
MSEGSSSGESKAGVHPNGPLPVAVGGPGDADRRTLNRAVILAVTVAALGYFVDIFDLLLFAIVRDKSLLDLGFADDQQRLKLGVYLDNYLQMTGLMVGGLVWGVIGDLRGRLSVLFGSILCYSTANLLNAFVADVPPNSALGFLNTVGLGSAIRQYEVLRFIAGFGLAGELGAGVTLVAELMGREKRGIGTTIVASVGVLGAVFAAVISKYCHWRTAYLIGGGLGLALLFLRVGVVESGLFNAVRSEAVGRGHFWKLVSSWTRFRRYLAVVAIGLPIWYAVGVLVKYSRDIGRDLQLGEATVAPADAIMWCYVGLAIGDLGSGLLSQWLRSRRWAVITFHILTAIAVALQFVLVPRPLIVSNLLFLALGISIGYWAVFVTMAAEQFGTNLRATAATTAPNFVRWIGAAGSALLWTSLEPYLGTWQAAAVVGAIVLAIALAACLSLRETFGTSLDFVEE